MSRNRIAVGMSVAALGLALTIGTAVADVLPGNGCSGPCPSFTPPSETTTTTTPTGEVLPNNEVNAPATGETANVLPATETNLSPAVVTTPVVAAQTAGSSGLPVTGGDIAGLTALGAVALGTGTVLVRRGRRRHA